MTTVSSKPHIRWMISRDMPEVLSIEHRSFEVEWKHDDFMRCLRQRNSIGMCAESPDEIVIGYMIYELHKGYLDLLNFAVDPDYRRQGIGRSMVDKLKYKLTSQRRSSISLTIRESNLEGQLFFRAMGFVALEILRGHYDETSEDGYLMRYRYEWRTQD